MLCRTAVHLLALRASYLQSMIPRRAISYRPRANPHSIPPRSSIRQPDPKSELEAKQKEIDSKLEAELEAEAEEQAEDDTGPKSKQEAKIEVLEDLYDTAHNDYEIAFEETLNKSTSASLDREAAYVALTKLRMVYDDATCKGEQSIRAAVGRRMMIRVRGLEDLFGDLERRVEKEEKGEGN
ncbi:hypothetical protein MMC09_002218 [Bachmanniomyces sp. S44760]|nr:hypothetical protein [Bachmanniomyces sp. S44760]